MTPCKIANCPAHATNAKNCLCPVHQHARTAKELHIARDTKGYGGERCVKCKRLFKADDWVSTDKVETTKRRKTAKGYAHVVCEPLPPSKKECAAAGRPLLDEAEG